jgi:hypothetical protein
VFVRGLVIFISTKEPTFTPVGWNWDPILLFHLMLHLIAELKEIPHDLEVNTRIYGEQYGLKNIGYK